MPILNLTTPSDGLETPYNDSITDTWTPTSYNESIRFNWTEEPYLDSLSYNWTAQTPNDSLAYGWTAEPSNDSITYNWSAEQSGPTPAARIPPGSFLAFKVAIKLHIISTIILAIVGTVGNCLSFVILSTKAMRSSTSSIYLRALAVSDNLTLWAYLLLMVAQNYEFVMISKAFCKIMLMMSSAFQQVSSYLVIFMTAERFFAVAFPLNVARVFTHRLAWIMVAVIYAIFLFFNIPYALFVVSYYDVICSYDYKNYSDLIAQWTKVDPVIASYIPAVVILLLNILIIRQVVMANKNAQNLTGNDKVKGQGKTGDDQATQITKMLLSVSIAYWVLTIPMAIFFLGKDYWFDPLISKEYANLALTQYVMTVLFLTNNSCNFFLYCMTGNKFRQVLKSMLPCFKKPSTRGTSLATLSKMSASTVNTSLSTVNTSLSTVNTDGDRK